MSDKRGEQACHGPGQGSYFKKCMMHDANGVLNALEVINVSWRPSRPN